MNQKRMRAALQGKAPGVTAEKILWASGYGTIVGLDEVGKGAWAGPLTVGAVVVNQTKRITGVRDSKMLNEKEREILYDRITNWARAWAVGHVSNDECDELGMSDAQRLAAKRALAALELTPDKVLLDGNWDFVGGGISQPIVKGDTTSLSIAAASIVAKVSRDRLLREADKKWPDYSFSSNKGYPCPRHREALSKFGATTFHRRSWKFMADLPPIGEPPRFRNSGEPRLFN
ncbi:MAG: ribonuclease HII [Acidimicrobiaceae bacterium]|jgi:ribonuclease HII|nr:ribonuclease HII [Acidimicrobiaceae bacterium]|tara:strand:+ start:1730 stop:2425 length:696 start_codon:yes stop_codon:yes gene_type:complete